MSKLPALLLLACLYVFPVCSLSAQDTAAAPESSSAGEARPGAGAQAPATPSLPGTVQSTRHVPEKQAPPPQGIPLAGALLILYLIGLLVGRWAWIVVPNGHYLRAQAERIRSRLNMGETTDDTEAASPDGKKAAIEKLLDKVTTELVPEHQAFFKWLFAYTGRQMAAWRLLHEAECLAIDLYSDDLARIQAKSVLDKLPATRSGTDNLEEDIRKAVEIQDGNLQELVAGTRARIDQQEDDAAISASLEQDISNALVSRMFTLRGLLKEAKTVIHNDQDGEFEALADGQNKALWLIFTAALIVFGLSVLFPQAQPLFIAGAAGGLLARLRRVVKKRTRPFDYGVSWTVLFLSPIVGALTAWAGVLLFELLVQWELLSDQFAGVSLDSPDNNATYIVALVFGFSATLFDKFVDKLEEGVGG